MRILITCTEPCGSGSFTVAKAVLDELTAQGHEALLFFPDNSESCLLSARHPEKYAIWRFPIGKGLDFFPLIIPEPHPKNLGGKTFLELSDESLVFYFDAAAAELRKVIEEFKPDIIECEHIWAFDHLIGKWGYPFISVAHNTDQLGFKYDFRMQSRILESVKKTPLLLAVSGQVKDEAALLYGIAPEKIALVPNGYDQKVFKPQTVERKRCLENLQLDIPLDAFLVSFTGKISKMKGIDTLLEANALLKAEEKIHFLVPGIGDIQKTLSKEKSYCFDRVHFIGQKTLPELAALHNICDIGLLCSRSEGFGIAALEAMGCALPVIVTRSGGPEEFAVGAVVEPGEPKALAGAILSMKRMPQKEFKALKDEALGKALEFTWKKSVEQRVRYYTICKK